MFRVTRLVMRVFDLDGSRPFNLLLQGTGSYPPGLNGWHRAMRLTPSHAPFSAPYLTIACAVYSLQLGTNLHAGGKAADSVR